MRAEAVGLKRKGNAAVQLRIEPDFPRFKILAAVGHNRLGQRFHERATEAGLPSENHASVSSLRRRRTGGDESAVDVDIGIARFVKRLEKRLAGGEGTGHLPEDSRAAVEICSRVAV